MAKFLVFSDLHIHPFSAFATYQDGINSRLKEITQALKTILYVAERDSVDAILFCGDFFHTRRLDPETLEMASRAIFSTKTPIIAISGNHDQSDQLGEFTSISSLKGRLRILKSGESEKIKGLKICGVPYQGDKNSLLKKIPSDADILMVHTGIGNAMMGSELVASDHEFIPMVELLGKAGVVLSGHFHQPHLFTNQDVILPLKDYVVSEFKMGRTAIIPGAPVQHGFGDEGSIRGYWILDTQDNMARFHQLVGPDFYRLTAEEACGKSHAQPHGYATITIPEGMSSKRLDALDRHFQDTFRAYNLITESSIEPPKTRINIGVEQSQKDIIETYCKAMMVSEDIMKTGKRLLREAIV